MLRVSDIEDRKNYTYYFGGVEFKYNHALDNFIIVKIDTLVKKIWL